MLGTIFVDNSYAADYESPLFPLFFSEIADRFKVTSTFSELDSAKFPILTNITEYVAKRLAKSAKSRYGLILDGRKNWSDWFRVVAGAEFVLLIGGNGGIEKLNHVRQLGWIVPSIGQTQNRWPVTDLVSLDDLYSDLLDGASIPSRLYVFYGNIMAAVQSYAERFAQIDVELRFLKANADMFSAICRDGVDVYHPSSDMLTAISAQDAYDGKDGTGLINAQAFAELLDEQIGQATVIDVEREIVNIICFRPTYLFLDLVRRFEAVGCVVSDFPLENAKSYIWMRPQEIWHYEALIEGKTHKEISATYLRGFQDEPSKNINVEDLLRRSVAIHHGTCYEPLYQFDYERLARSLRLVNRVVGVCEFEECYGPSHEIANRTNFEFVPIGYDHKLFNETHRKTEALEPATKLKLGFVGRAYGTFDKEQLGRSRLAEPKGYRKGGDLLLDVALRLKSRGVPFELHIVGQNWEHLVDLLDRYAIEYVYYARDRNITYEDYPSVYAKMDALMITARCEGGPVSAIEALSLGVKIISTNVGVVQFLEKHMQGTDGCSVFDYDKKWHIAESELAVIAVEELYKNGRSKEDIAKTHGRIADFTTDDWVRRISKLAHLVDA
ncbi:glycosyltransferase [Achromobacter pestifer]|uniref:Uncharacterized protein n=1 Tax=Achromobacter pestifer TaxID=1353889 RepID=A0A6S6YJQ9_9BURK|nr:glycosyltransferase [Achromobacter pestifer]CAB3626858.1 hypothetical protein LMG3431_00411 [Achromobacter pestifer]